MGLAGVRRLTREREVANLLVRALKEADNSKMSSTKERTPPRARLPGPSGLVASPNSVLRSKRSSTALRKATFPPLSRGSRCRLHPQSPVDDAEPSRGEARSAEKPSSACGHTPAGSCY